MGPVCQRGRGSPASSPCAAAAAAVHLHRRRAVSAMAAAASSSPPPSPASLPSRRVCLAATQFAVTPGDEGGNVATAERLIRQAAARGANVILLQASASSLGDMAHASACSLYATRRLKVIFLWVILGGTRPRALIAPRCIPRH